MELVQVQLHFRQNEFVGWSQGCMLLAVALLLCSALSLAQHISPTTAGIHL